MRKKGEFKAQQERHRKRQALWDGVKKLRAGEEAVLTISGKKALLRPYNRDTINEARDSGKTVLYLVRVGVKALVLGEISHKDCDVRIATVVLGNPNSVGYKCHGDSILGICVV